MKRAVAIALCVTCYLLLTACSQRAAIHVDVEEVNPWTHLELNNDPRNFQFIIVSDRTGGERAGVFPKGIQKTNLLQPQFVMSVGDLIEGYTEDTAQLDREWDEFDGFVKQFEMPFFYLAGNHDYSNRVMAEVWKQRYGRTYYHFMHHDVLFLCLNSEPAWVGGNYTDQLAYIARVLQQHAQVRWTLVFIHKPLWTYDGSDKPEGQAAYAFWSQVETMLQGRKHTAYAGHFHTYNKHRRGQANYFVLATTGGGSQLRGPAFGEFDHVVWITMTDQGPRLANLMLDGIADENIRVAEHTEH